MIDKGLAFGPFLLHKHKQKDTDMIKIELEGSNTAICKQFDITVKHAQSPLTRLARQLAKMGVNMEETVEVYRGKTICFAPARLVDWARLTTVEEDETSVRHQKTRIIKTNEANIKMHDLLFGEGSP